MSERKSAGRRKLIQAAGLAMAAGLARPANAEEPNKAKGNVKQSLCRWCYNKVPLDKLAQTAVELGYKSIELIGPQDFLKIKAYGLTCSMLSGAQSIASCLNRFDQHDRVEKELRAAIEFAAAEGLPNVICFSGNRRGMPDDEGAKNCAIGLKRVVGLAEEKKVNVCMELLNSKVDHHDYMCDHTLWGVNLCKQVGSPRFKLLYDIYHMQIMEGDVIATIRKYKDYIAHFHTGGVPGRHEIDETQELYYPAVMKAIVDMGYTGYVAQEFIPARNWAESLKQAFHLCDV
jgi:hydroxypyruvate isomerase